MRSKFNKRTVLNTRINALYITYTRGTPSKFKRREWIHETPIPVFQEVLNKIKLDNAASALNKMKEVVTESIIEQ